MMYPSNYRMAKYLNKLTSSTTAFSCCDLNQIQVNWIHSVRRGLSSSWSSQFAPASPSNESSKPRNSDATTKARTASTFTYQINDNEIIINNVSYKKDAWTNVTPKILSHLGRNLHLQQHHPLGFLRHRIVDFFYKSFPSRTRSPKFTVFDNLHPAVTTRENFDSLLVPADHPSRSKSDCYFLNETHLLRGHTSCHQADLIKMGMNNFLVVGDVYRRDEIDKSHYPIFHQVEGVKLFTKHEIFRDDNLTAQLPVFEEGKRTPEKQESHTLDAVYIMTKSLKTSLNNLLIEIFGKDVEIRWNEEYFPFTHPSWEVEVKFAGEWLEILGCGIMEQKLLANAGAHDKIGWAFGLGLERIAMKVYGIPDIRLFWSTDSGFLHQFQVDDPHTPITYKAVSQYPPCSNDISFWIPSESSFCSNDFYDLVRSIGGDLVEQVSLVDKFHHPKKNRWSHCYRIVYRHMQKTLKQEEANEVHKLIEEAAIKDLCVQIR